MTTWKLRSPENFPARFSGAMREGLRRIAFGEAAPKVLILSGLNSRTSAQTECHNFRYWKWCSQRYPLYDLHSAWERFEGRLRIIPSNGEFAVWLTLRRKEDLADLAGILARTRTCE